MAQGRATSRDLYGPDPVPYDPRKWHLEREPLLTVYLNMHCCYRSGITDELHNNNFHTIYYL